jgi:hypothetical protein
MFAISPEMISTARLASAPPPPGGQNFNYCCIKNWARRKQSEKHTTGIEILTENQPDGSLRYRNN